MMPKIERNMLHYIHTNKRYAGQAVPEEALAVPESRVLIMERMQTPWGIALTKQELAEGIFWVETAEQGGLLIEQMQAQALLSEAALKIGQTWETFLVYEQEQDLPVVFYEHPELYPWAEEELTEKLAEDSLHLSHPEYFQH